MAEHLPRFEPGAAVTFTASAAITGGQLVAVTGGRRVAPAAAGSTAVIGVALNDAAAEAEVPVLSVGVHRLTAAAAVAAGDQVIAAAAGQVTPVGAGTAFQVVGKALEAIAAGARGLIQINLS